MTDSTVAIARQIRIVRGQRVLIDEDLAALYGIPTRRLNEQVRRNADRFPSDFIIILTNQEAANLKSQFATSSSASWGGRRKLPVAFTEHGAIMAASVLNSPRAVEMSVHVVRAFVRMRQIIASSEDLTRRLEVLERSVAKLDGETRKEFASVYKAILSLIGVPPPGQ